MKNKQVIALAIIFFVLLNTTYYWTGICAFFFGLVCMSLYFLVLFLALLVQVWDTLKEKGSNKFRFVNVAVLTAVIVLSYMFPNGLIDFDRLEGKDVLIATLRGTANCTTTLQLKSNDRFKFSSFCFGADRIKGKYSIKQDTVFFNYDKRGDHHFTHWSFGVIEQREKFKVIKNNLDFIGTIHLFRTANDSFPYPLNIYLNTLPKK